MSANESVVAEITEDCLLTRARRIARVMTNLYDQELRPFGINSPQFTLLVIISKLRGASRAEIGRYNHQDRSTLTRNLQLILSAGWVEEQASTSGGRARPLVLTEAGKNLLRSAAPAWRQAQSQARAVLGTAGTAAVLDIANSL